MAKTELNREDWIQIDPETLADDVREAYEAYKEAYRYAKDLRKAFEAKVNDAAPSGKRIVVGYNFGKLSMAIVEASEAKAPAKAKQSLADFLAMQQAVGRRA